MLLITTPQTLLQSLLYYVINAAALYTIFFLGHTTQKWLKYEVPQYKSWIQRGTIIIVTIFLLITLYNEQTLNIAAASYTITASLIYTAHKFKETSIKYAPLFLAATSTPITAVTAYSLGFYYYCATQHTA